MSESRDKKKELKKQKSLREDNDEGKESIKNSRESIIAKESEEHNSAPTNSNEPETTEASGNSPSSEKSNSRTSSTTLLDEEENKNDIVFENLSPMEQERLSISLSEQIIGGSSILNSGCCLFCRWVGTAFLPNAAKPAPTVLTNTLENIEKNFEEEENEEPDRLFWEGGSVRRVEEYYSSIKHNREVKIEDADIYSLAVACKDFIRREINFIDIKVYEEIIKQYKVDENHNNGRIQTIVEMLPFVMYQRAMLSYILSIAKKEDSDEFYEDWGSVIFKENDNVVINGKLIKELTEVDFNVVDKKFFDLDD